MLSAIGLGVATMIVVAMLTLLLGRTPVERAAHATALALWLALLLWADSVLPRQEPHAVAAAAATAVALLSLVAFSTRRSRARLRLFPLPMLIALQAVRIAGVSFALLHAVHRLPAPFAPIVGWGDILAGATALPLAMWSRRNVELRLPLLLWTAYGIADLTVALALGAASAPLLVSCFLVPALIFAHLASAYRLSLELRRTVRA